MEDDLAVELEALAATYGDEVTIVKPGDDEKYLCIINFHMAPRGVEFYNAYVTGVMRLMIPRGYPDVSPCIELLDTKGLGDQRLAVLNQRLCSEADMLMGDMALGALCEHALDLMTEQNRPEGSSRRQF